VLRQLEASGVKIDTINSDEHPDLCQKYGITSLPTFIINPGTRLERKTTDIEEVVAEVGT